MQLDAMTIFLKRTFVKTKEEIQTLYLHVPVNSNRGKIITSCCSVAGFVCVLVFLQTSDTMKLHFICLG